MPRTVAVRRRVRVHQRLGRPRRQLSHARGVQRSASRPGTDSLPALFHAVGTMKNEKQVKAAYNEFLAVLKTCQRVSLADEGVSLELMVSSNHDRTHKNVDCQVNVAALGTASKDGDSLPFGVWLSWMSLDNNITLVGYANVNENKKANRSLNGHAYTAFAKLQAVMGWKALAEAEPSRSDDGLGRIGRRRPRSAAPPRECSADERAAARVWGRAVRSVAACSAVQGAACCGGAERSAVRAVAEARHR